MLVSSKSTKPWYSHSKYSSRNREKLVDHTFCHWCAWEVPKALRVLTVLHPEHWASASEFILALPPLNNFKFLNYIFLALPSFPVQIWCLLMHLNLNITRVPPRYGGECSVKNWRGQLFLTSMNAPADPLAFLWPGPQTLLTIRDLNNRPMVSSVRYQPIGEKPDVKRMTSIEQ